LSSVVDTDTNDAADSAAAASAAGTGSIPEYKADDDDDEGAADEDESAAEMCRLANNCEAVFCTIHPRTWHSIVICTRMKTTTKGNIGDALVRSTFNKRR
jgi:hypothetical protein